MDEKRSKGHRVTSGVLGVLLLALGITLCILIDQKIKQSGDSDVQTSTSSGTLISHKWLWCVGLLYVIPGITGIISGGTGVKAAYITHIVLEIIALLVAGVFVIIFFLSMSVLQLETMADDNCRSQIGQLGYNDDFCTLVHTIVMMVRAIVSLFTIGWIMALADVIHASVAMCRSNPTPGSIVVSQSPPPQHVMMVYPNTMMNPAAAGWQAYSTSDTAVLVNNMENKN